VLGGAEIPAGSSVFLVFGAANRDEACYAEPGQFDACRPSPRQHLAFGRGKHFCLGAPVARLETAVAFKRLAERFEAPVLSPQNTYEHRSGFVVPGLNELFVELTPR
jgi:cytochrome P450